MFNVIFEQEFNKHDRVFIALEVTVSYQVSVVLDAILKNVEKWNELYKMAENLQCFFFSAAELNFISWMNTFKIEFLIISSWNLYIFIWSMFGYINNICSGFMNSSSCIIILFQISEWDIRMVTKLYDILRFCFHIHVRYYTKYSRASVIRPWIIRHSVSSAALSEYQN